MQGCRKSTICIDYSRLNKVIVKILLVVVDIWTPHQLGHAKIYSKIDLWEAHNIVYIKGKDEWKTSFQTR